MNQALPTEAEVLYRVTADEFVAFLQRTMFDATAYLFPDDRSWCFVNFEDGLAPVIGLSAAQAGVSALGETLLLNQESVVC